MSDTIKLFCPYCWAELDKEYDICPYCKSSLEEFMKLDFDEKLILGLSNPVTENRMFVIEVLGKRKVEKAVHKLCEMLFSQRDTYELIEIVKTLYLISSNEAISCIKEARDKINNKILASFIEECLNELYQ